LCYEEIMPEQTVITFDVETVPDLSAAARMLGLGTAADADVRDALGPGFPKHPLHKIVCIGALVASRQVEGWRMDALGAPYVGDRSEANLIKAFAEKVGTTEASTHHFQWSCVRSAGAEISGHGEPCFRRGASGPAIFSSLHG
jgi:hypothetical protein